MVSKKSLVLAHLGLFWAAAFYAGNFTIVKLVMPAYILPFAFILLRAIAATFLFALTHALFIRQSIDKSDLPRLIICGLSGIAINQLFFFKGLSYTTPIHGALIMLTTPILVILFAMLAMGERATWQKLIGIGLGMAGAGSLVWGSSQPTFNASNPILGDLFVGINAASYAVYLIAVKPLMVKYNAITVLKWVFSIGLLAILPVAWSEFIQIEWQTFTPMIWWAVAYVLICVTFLTYLFNTAALRVVSSSVVSAYIYLQPLLTAVIAVFTGQDVVTPMILVAGALIFVGVYLVSKN